MLLSLDWEREAWAFRSLISGSHFSWASLVFKDNVNNFKDLSFENACRNSSSILLFLCPEAGLYSLDVLNVTLYC